MYVTMKLMHFLFFSPHTAENDDIVENDEKYAMWLECRRRGDPSLEETSVSSSGPLHYGQFNWEFTTIEKYPILAKRIMADGFGGKGDKDSVAVWGVSGRDGNLHPAQSPTELAVYVTNGHEAMIYTWKLPAGEWPETLEEFIPLWFVCAFILCDAWWY